MTITFNKLPGQKIVELGCGDRPHPQADCHVDCRANQYTHFACDFNEPLPISSDEWDAVYSCFVLEHVSWRKVPQFVSEMFRILKPGGSLVLVIPNTEAQMRHILKTQDWDDASCMLFGDQDYPENSHKAAFSPTSIQKLLGEVGFSDIQILPFGELQTDMSVIAKKPSLKEIVSERIQEAYSQQVDAEFIPEPTPNVLGSNVEQVETLKEARERERVQEAKTNLEAYEQREKYATQWTVTCTVEEPIQIPVESTELSQEPQVPPELSPSIPDDSRRVPEGGSTRREGRLQIIGSGTVHPIRGRDGYDPETWFDHAYFDGGTKVGGYAPPGYRDFPSNEIIAREILNRKPESVLELGCGRGFVLKRVQDAGVRGFGLDVSKHAYMTRVCDDFVCEDATRQPWPFTTHLEKFDLCYSVAFLDHIPETLLPYVIQEMKRVSKRGVHALDFSPYDGFDKTRLTIKPKTWWEDTFKNFGFSCEIIDKREWEDPSKFPQDVLRGDGRIKLNIGSCTVMFHHGWTNIDVLDLERFSQGNGYNYLRHDVRNGLPMFGTGVVDCIYSSHFLEHLTYEEGLKFLKECRRVIRPETGAMRILVPDAALLMECYIQDPDWGEEETEWILSDFDHVNWGCHKAKTPAQKLWALLHDGHQAAYDEQTLIAMLKEAGFIAAKLAFRETVCEGLGNQILRETLDVLPCLSLIVEATALT